MTRFTEKATVITPSRELQPDEYFNETDHLIYCSKCNTPRKCRHELQGKQVNEELLDDAVAEVIAKLVGNPKFAAMMQEKINMKVDTTAIEQEISAYSFLPLL